MSKVLNKWFESEPLKACLATDAVIGAMLSPHTPGSGYVLLHHVMGGVEGRVVKLRIRAYPGKLTKKIKISEKSQN